MTWRNAYNALSAQQAAAQAKPHRRQAYWWCRLDHDFIDKPLWRAVARKVGVPVHAVVAVVLRLECLATKSSPRGSIADMSVPEFAAALDLRPEAVARIRSALEEPDTAWVDQDVIVDFFQRNPDHSDSTATERKRRQRAKLKEARDDAIARAEGVARGPPSLSTGHGMSRRDTVTGHTRADQIRKKEGQKNLPGQGLAERPQGPSEEESGTGTVHSNSGEIGDGLTDREEAELWIAHEGARIIMSRAGILYPSRAKFELERLRKQIGDDMVALAHIIAQADTLEHSSGGRFLDWLRQAINQHRRDSAGQLPLSLKTSLKRSGAS